MRLQTFLEFLKEKWGSKKKEENTENAQEEKTVMAEHWPLDNQGNKQPGKVLSVTITPYVPDGIVEGEDPNRKITHLPPSDRLH